MKSIFQLATSAIRNARDDAPADLPGAGRSGGFAQRLFGGGQGVAHQLSQMGNVGTVFAIADAIASEVASAQWHLYKKAKSGKDEDRVEVTSHACIDLWNKPNPHYDQQQFVETVQQHLELVGEGDMLVGWGPRIAGPLSLWPVRPDYLEPDKHPREWLTGWHYRQDNGTKVPLGLDEVLQIRRPNPLDPWRGLGPVQSLLADLDATKYSAEWNRNFFLNDATPGGVIEIPESLEDHELDDLVRHWEEQHRGVRNAHRVAFVELGKWQAQTFTMRDMQFVELRNVSRDMLMEAWRISPWDLGRIEDVNRAAAVAADTRFAKKITVPRLDRWRGMLNGKLLPMFGDTSRDLEWDYDSPVPEDSEEENQVRDSKVGAVGALAEAGVDLDQIAQWLDLPFVKVDQGLSPQQQAVLMQKSYLIKGTGMTRTEYRTWLKDRVGLEQIGDPGEWDEAEPPAPVVLPPGPPVPGQEPSEEDDQEDRSGKTSVDDDEDPDQEES